MVPVVVAVVGPAAVRGTVAAVEAEAVREAGVAHRADPVAAIVGRLPGAALVEEVTTIGGSAVIDGPGRVSGPIADAGAPMRQARPTGAEWHDGVPAVLSARNTRTVQSAGHGPPSGRPGPVVPSLSDPTG